jgi:hypothetical protein
MEIPDKGVRAARRRITYRGQRTEFTPSGEKTMRILRLVVAVVALLSLVGSVAFAATICPTNFKCGFTAAAAQAITGSKTDGSPFSAVGVLTFNASGRASASVMLNFNGESSGPFFVGSGTCTTDLSGIGTLDFSAGGGPAFNFVSTDGGNELRFINVTSGFTGVGLCKVQ